MPTITITLQQHLLVTIAKLERAVAKQSKNINSLANRLRAFENELLDDLDGCADNDDSDVGTVTPSKNSNSIDCIPISTAHFSGTEVGVDSECASLLVGGPIVTPAAGVPSRSQDTAAAGSALTPANQNPKRVRHTRGRKLCREGAFIVRRT